MVNLDQETAIMVALDTGNIELPIDLFVRELDATDGSCKAAPPASYATTIAASDSLNADAFVVRQDVDPPSAIDHGVHVKSKDESGGSRARASLPIRID